MTLALGESTRVREERGDPNVEKGGLRVLFASACGLGAGLIGAAALAGWSLDIAWLKQLSPTVVAMNPVTATCLLLLSAGLLIRAARLDRLPSGALGGLVIAIAVIVLVQLALGHPDRVDLLLFAAKVNATNTVVGTPMAPNTAVVLTFLGLATVIAGYRSSADRHAGPFAVIAAVISFVTLFGYVFDVSDLYDLDDGTRRFIAMAPTTAISSLLLAAGVLGLLHNGRVAEVSAGQTRVRLVTVAQAIVVVSALVLTIAVALWSQAQVSLQARLLAERQDTLRALALVRAEVRELEAHVLSYVVSSDLGDLRAASGSGNLAAALPSHASFEADLRLALQDLGGAIGKTVGNLRVAASLAQSGNREPALIALQAVNSASLAEKFAGVERLVRQSAEDHSRVREKFAGVTAGALLVGGSALAVLLLLLYGQIRQSLAYGMMAIARRSYDDILAAAPDAIIVVKPSGEIAFANERTGQVFGYDPSEVVGQPVEMLVPEASRSAHVERRTVYADASPTRRIMGADQKLVGLAKGGREFPVEISLSPVVMKDETHVIATVRDVTERRLLEAQSRSAELAQLASAAKSQFLASMSHEIRTPLNGVIGNIELLAQTDLTRPQVGLVTSADRAAKAMLALIGNILDFSKIEAGKLTLELEDVDPAAVVAEAVNVLQSRARQKDLTVSAVLSPALPSRVRCDGARLRQVLLNLVGNAVKFTDTGGILVRAWARALDGGTCELVFEVWDSGCGFEPGRGADLFQAFTDRGAAGSSIEGAGLGLSICRSVVEAMGGSIGAEGFPDEGAMFRFTIPVEVRAGAMPVECPDLSGLRILDLTANRAEYEWLDVYFRARGATTERAEPSAGGLDAWADAEPPLDAVVVSAGDAGTGAPELARRLRKAGTAVLVVGDGDLSEAAARKVLRQGLAALLPLQRDDGDADREAYLDRNITAILGQAHHADEPEQSERFQASTASFAGARVLVLEDRLLNQTVIRKQLDLLGVHCTLASNGREGFEVLRWQTFDAILCDCSMPEMSGYEFTRLLREREAADGSRRVPIIALTANAFRDDRDRCLEAGMDDFLSKPVTLSRLSAVLVRWLENAEGAAPAVDSVEAPGILPVSEDRGRDAGAVASAAETTRTPAAPRSETGGPATYDPGALVRYVGDDAATNRAILAEFVQSAAACIADAEHGTAVAEAPAVMEAAHRLKSAARTVGANALADLSLEIERAAKAEDWPRLRELTPRLGPRFEAFKRVAVEGNTDGNAG